MNNGETGGLYYYWVYLERFDHSTLRKEEIKVPHIYKANGVAWDNDELLAHLEKLKDDTNSTLKKFNTTQKNSLNDDNVPKNNPVKRGFLGYVFTPKKVDFVKKEGLRYEVIESKNYTEIKKSLPSLFTLTRAPFV